MNMQRILTDRGIEFYGKAEHHDYEFYLDVNDIEHTKTKTRHPQTNQNYEDFIELFFRNFIKLHFAKSEKSQLALTLIP